jgi:predicted 2-oxoglutarate/Fe(II)-dependent dioxygenase YbiX
MILDSQSPNYRIVKNFLNEQELLEVKKDIKYQTEDAWNYEFNLKYPKEEDVSSNFWTGLKQWGGMSISLNNKELLDSIGMDIEIYNQILKKAKKQVEQRFDVKVKVEQYLLNRWRVGRSQSPHVDYILEKEENNYENLYEFGMDDEYISTFKEKYKTKNFSTMVYLNSDFGGGELYFPHYDDLHIKPEENMMICFKGDSNHMHGVKEVTGGTRYTLSLFWTEV